MLCKSCKPPLGSDYEPLSLFGSDDSLLLTFEGYDQSVNAISQYDSSEPWSFTDLDHLGALNSEDFLSLNLLKNSDAGNVLWEWAFESVSIDSVLLDEEDLADDGTLIISADDLPLPIRAIRFGSERDQSEPHIMTWKVIEGDARILEGALVRAIWGRVSGWPRWILTRWLITRCSCKAG